MTDIADVVRMIFLGIGVVTAGCRWGSRDDLLAELYRLARPADANLHLVLDSSLGTHRLSDGMSTTAAGRTYWPLVGERGGLGEAWLRLTADALHGWRPGLGFDAPGVVVRPRR